MEHYYTCCTGLLNGQKLNLSNVAGRYAGHGW